MQGQGQPDGAFELPTISEAVHAGGDDRSPIAGLSGFQPALTWRFGPLGGRAPSAPPMDPPLVVLYCSISVRVFVSS